MIDVEICYGTPDKQVLKSFKIKEGTTALEAVKMATLETDFPEINLTDPDLGIFSQKITHDTVLKGGDRVEVYRPLIIDPMTKRRIRAKQ